MTKAYILMALMQVSAFATLPRASTRMLLDSSLQQGAKVETDYTLRSNSVSRPSSQSRLAGVLELGLSWLYWRTAPASLAGAEAFRQETNTSQDRSRNASSLVSEGSVIVIYFVAIALSLVGSLTALWQYRRRVRVLMHLASTDPKLSEATVRSNKPRTPKIEYITNSYLTDKAVKMREQMRRALVVYLIAGLSQATIATFWWIRDQRLPFHVPILVTLLLVHLWPLLIAYFIFNGQDHRRRAVLVALYLALLGLVSVPFGIRDVQTEGLTIPGVVQIYFLWAALMIMPTVGVWSFLRRQVRAAGPMTFAMCLCATTGVWTGMVLIEYDYKRALEIAVNLFHLGASIALFSILFAVGAACFIVGWWINRLAGFVYRRKIINHQMITLDALFLNFSIAEGIYFVLDRGVLVGFMQVLMILAAYRIVLAVGLIWLKGTSRSEDNNKLLLLRVFRQTRETDKLMNVVGTSWLYSGSIQLMGAFDLASSTVQPNQFLDFLGGKLDHHFVKNVDDLQHRFGEIDFEPDADGRYRINEVLCQGTIWKEALHCLTEGAAILMDLRGFIPDNESCKYELRVLFETVPLDRIVIVADESDGSGHLHKAIEEAWQTAALGGPNDQLAQQTLRVVQAKRISALTGRQICNALLSTPRREDAEVAIGA